MTEDLIIQVTRMCNSNAPKEAMPIIDAALEINANDPIALYFKAHIAYVNYEFLNALQVANRLIQLGVESEIVLLLQGRIHYKLKNLDAAEEVFKKVLRTSPNQAEALHYIGRVAGYTDANYGVRRVKVESNDASKEVFQEEDNATQMVYSAKGEQQIVEKLAGLLDCKKYCIDIGALDGVRFSNTYGLFTSGWEGAVFECSKANITELAKNLSQLSNHIQMVPKKLSDKEYSVQFSHHFQLIFDFSP